MRTTGKSKRYLIKTLFILSAIILMASGCTRKESPYHPNATSGPTPTPYVTGEVDVVESADIVEGYIGTMEIDGTEYPVIIHESLSYCLIGDHAAVVYTLFTDDTLEEYNIAATVEYESKTYPVTAIDDEVFYGFADAIKITVPSSVKIIGENSFDGCDALEEIILSEGLEEIKDAAFNDCSALRSVTIPSTVTKMGTGIFFGCTALESAIFSEGVTSIPDDTFTNCESLANVVIPSTVKTIGSEAFWSCTSLVTVTIPEGVTAIADRCFYDCEKMTVVVLPGSLTSIGDDIFESCDSLVTVMVPTGYKDSFENEFEDYEFNIVAY